MAGRFQLCGWLLGGMCLVLSGCATTPEPTSSTSAQETPGATTLNKKPTPVRLAEQRNSRFASLKSWTIIGRLGIKQGEEGFSAGMEWLQDGQKFDIRLSDPLGRKVARLVGDDKHVSLETVNGKRHEAENAEQLLEQQLGWTFPVQSLLYWVKGVPNPNLLVWRQEYDDAGRLVSLKQGNWTVTITKYQNLNQEYVPRLARMEREDIRVKLLIREWE